MIELYTWPTPNGHKVHIMLEETGLEWTVHPINIQEGAQFDPEFLKISPNNKMPAIVDREGPGGEPISVFESGAILIYLANKSGKFLPLDPRKYYDVLQWLMFQMGGIGPMLGQAHHFHNYAPQRVERDKLQYGIDRYVNEANRLYGVLERHLDGREWVAADEYTIADMATFPWLRVPENQGVEIDDYPNVKRWRDKVWRRPAVEKALETLAEHRRSGPGFTDKAWEIMYGQTQRSQGAVAAGDGPPDVAEDPPVIADQAQAAGEERPVVGDAAPAAAEDIPVVGDATPAAAEDIPVVGDATQPAAEDTSVVGDAAPAAEEEKPAAE